MNIQELAAEAARYFERVQRSGETDPDRYYVRTKDGTPQWVRDLVQSAHGEFFPDDWRYETIQDALETIADVDDAEDARHEFADEQVAPYTSDRIAWLASNLRRSSYCDDAQSEFGIDGNAGIVDLIGLGMYAEADEVYGLTLNALEARLDED